MESSWPLRMIFETAIVFVPFFDGRPLIVTWSPGFMVLLDQPAFRAIEFGPLRSPDHRWTFPASSFASQ